MCLSITNVDLMAFCAMHILTFFCYGVSRGLAHDFLNLSLTEVCLCLLDHETEKRRMTQGVTHRTRRIYVNCMKTYCQFW